MKISEKNAIANQDGPQGSKESKVPCDVMNIKKIKERCKRYDPNSSKKGKVKTSVEIKCAEHGEID